MTFSLLIDNAGLSITVLKIQNLGCKKRAVWLRVCEEGFRVGGTLAGRGAGSLRQKVRRPHQQRKEAGAKIPTWIAFE